MLALRASMVAIAVLVASTARADVFEVGDDGTLAVRSGAGTVAWTGGSRPFGEDDDADEPAPDVPAHALTLVVAPEAPAAMRGHLLQAAARYDVSPALLAALVWQESRWQPAALSAKGAIGLGQLMPATARALAVDPREPAANLQGAAHYLRQLLDLFDGDVERALAAYNAGPGRVLKANGVPRIAETQSYVSRIIDRLAPASNPGATQ